MTLLPALQRFLVGLVSRTWVLAAVTVIICAGFAARAVGSLVSAAALADAPHSTIPSGPPRVALAPARTKLDGTQISRNIFCSSCEPAEVAVTTGHYTGEPAVLIATMMGHEPRATVRVLASEAQGSWGIGEAIPGVGLIDRIGATSIDVVDVSGHRGTLSLLEASQAGGRETRPDPARSGPAAPADPFAERIRKIADNDYEVERALVRELVTGGTKPGAVRPVPVMVGGEIKGIRLLGVRGGSVAAAIGLRSNDVIGAIDGEPIKQVQQLLDLYAKLDQMTAVELTGTRAGKPLTLTLRLR